MAHLSTEAKESLVAKVLSGTASIRALAAANGVGYSSLQRWVNQVRKTGSTAGRPDCRHQGHPRPLEHLLATVGLDEKAVGAYCREQGIHSFQLEAWREHLMKESGSRQETGAFRKEMNALRSENNTLKKELYRKDKALAETTALLVLKKKSRLNLGGARGRLVTTEDRLRAIELVNEACADGARKHKACELLAISVRTLTRWEQSGAIDKRKGSERWVANKLTNGERQQVLDTVNGSEYRDLPPCQIVPRLADKGIYIASESTIYRILREDKQLVHRGLTKPAKHKRPPPHIATEPNQLWSWDITFLPSQVRGIFFYLYLIMDVYSRKIVGWTIQLEQAAVLAADLIQQACIDEGMARDQIVLHSDNGSPMKGATMLAMLETLGVVPSFSRPSVSDDNPFSESLFKTLKYRPNFPLTDKFETIFDARAWVIKFTQWYNNEHMHSGLKFITPAQRHSGVDTRIMNNRHNVYLRAKKQFPARWAGNTRNWQLPAIVTLNANKKANQKENKKELKATV